MVYVWLKHLHVLCVVVSGSLFLLRGGLMLAGHGSLRWRVWRWLPHLIDTVLLGSAIGLAWRLHQYPFVHGWLTAKVLALVVYIALGSIALKRGRTLRIRALAFGAALLAFAFIVTVARTRHPLGFLALLQP